jgi:hypothetical protein
LYEIRRSIELYNDATNETDKRAAMSKPYLVLPCMRLDAAPDADFPTRSKLPNLASDEVEVWSESVCTTDESEKEPIMSSERVCRATLESEITW